MFKHIFIYIAMIFMYRKYTVGIFSLHSLFKNPSKIKRFSF